MKKPLLIISMMLMASGAMASNLDKNLIGNWKSIDAKNGALNGVIVLNKDGSASMQADKGNANIETPKMVGKWGVKGKTLTLTMPPYGKSEMGYVLKNGMLSLTYDNNNTQNFKRQ